MRAKPRGHVGPRDRSAGALSSVILGVIYALASALDLAGLGTLS
jgi:hypothetical protein